MAGVAPLLGHGRPGTRAAPAGCAPQAPPLRLLSRAPRPAWPYKVSEGAGGSAGLGRCSGRRTGGANEFQELDSCRVGGAGARGLPLALQSPPWSCRAAAGRDAAPFPIPSARAVRLVPCGAWPPPDTRPGGAGGPSEGSVRPSGREILAGRNLLAGRARAGVGRLPLRPHVKF